MSRILAVVAIILVLASPIYGEMALSGTSNLFYPVGGCVDSNVVGSLAVGAGSTTTSCSWIVAPNLTYSLFAPFTAADTGAIADTTVMDASYGVTSGSLTVVDTSTGSVEVLSNKLKMIGTSSWTTTGVIGPALTKAAGLLYKGTISAHAATTGGLALHSSAALSGTPTHMLNSSTTTLQASATAGGALQAIGALTAGQSYTFEIVAGGWDSTGFPSTSGLYGASYYVKGGTEYATRTRVFQNTGDNTATLYPTISQNGATAESYDDVRATTFTNTAFFTPTAADSFTGTNGDLLTTHALDVGAFTWTKRVADSAWSIDTNTAEMTAAGTNPAKNAGVRYLYIDSAITDAIIDLKVVCDITAAKISGIFFRGSAETANGVNGWDYILFGDGANCDEYVQKTVDGTSTNVFTNTSGTMTNGTYYNLRIILSGNTIRVYRDGVKIGSDISDSFNATATWHGLYTTTALVDKAFDNFTIYPRTSTAYNVLDNY